MSKYSFKLAADALVKKNKGDHFSDEECVAAVEALDVLLDFAHTVNLKPLSFWLAHELSSFRLYASHRGLRLPRTE